jgi:Na+(H+)/acetate symporter ActP
VDDLADRTVVLTPPASGGASFTVIPRNSKWTTLGITCRTVSKTKSMQDCYTAGGGITGFQNGWARAGDYMLAAALLGVTSMVFFNGCTG